LTATGGGGTRAVDTICEKLDLAAVEAIDCGIEGTVSCDNRDTRPPRAGTGVAAMVVIGITGVGVVGREAAAVFFMGIEGEDESAGRPTDLEGEDAAAVVVVIVDFADLSETAVFLAGAGAVAEAFLVADAAGLETAGLDAAGFEADLA